MLNGVSGRFLSGELTAIMGPSGAGKTTLLNVLTGFSTNGMSGCVRALGRMGCGGSLLRKQSCYIMQDDRLWPHLTTFEALELAAKLRLPRGTTPKKRRLVVENILDTLGLTASSSVRSGSLSGGQRKRLSVALELVSNPSVIFLDEPTTGLDSSSAVQCIALLRQLARGGRTVIMTLHQPSAFQYEMLDHVYVLGQGGQCVYNGAPEMTVPFLASIGLPCPLYHSPADFLIEVASGDLGDHTKKMVEAVKGSGACMEKWRRAKKEDDNGTIIKHNPAELSDISGWQIISPVAADPTKTTIEEKEVWEDSRPISEFAKFRILLGRALWQIHCEWVRKMTYCSILRNFFL
ncbi:hypothetical protein J437_LFUL012425 [Ladona fulva]|uniref:ABC transporter domain-containing protein n=1 Tax=Ladona fulva TaxID=123851 RepID=A0A8K0KAL4_LADFU|nr:hypothetical protein J437_LFUL012425 [Ladona fulva]